jgi:hypothetical protein
VRCDTPLIHAFVTAPINDRNTAKIGMRTSLSDAASSIFFTRNAPESQILSRAVACKLRRSCAPIVHSP